MSATLLFAIALSLCGIALLLCALILWNLKARVERLEERRENPLYVLPAVDPVAELRAGIDKARALLNEEPAQHG